MSGRTASRKPPSPRASAASARTCGAVVGQGGEQQPARPAVLQLAHAGPRAAAAPRARRPRRRAPSRAGRRRPMRAQRLRAPPPAGRVVQGLRPGGRAARASPISPSAATAARRTVASSSASRASSAGRGLGAADAAERGGRRAAHAPVLVLEGQQQRRHRLRVADRAQALRGRAPQVAVGVATARAISGRTAAAARIAPSASTAAKRSSLRASARNGSRRGTASGVADLAERAQGHEPHLGIGVVEQRQEVAARSPGPRSLPERDAPPAGAPGCSRRAAPRAAGRARPARRSRPGP